MGKEITRRGQPREFIHVQLPVQTKELLRRVRYETRVSFTDILVRVLERAEKEAVLKEWIAAADSPASPQDEEASAA